ncbi:hypothetical protein BH24ACI3_BH24ACI3_16070 [soil metagenome]
MNSQFSHNTKRHFAIYRNGVWWINGRCLTNPVRTLDR